MMMMRRSYGLYSDPLVTYALDASNELSYPVDEWVLRLVWFQIIAKQQFGQYREDCMRYATIVMYHLTEVLITSRHE